MPSPPPPSGTEGRPNEQPISGMPSNSERVSPATAQTNVGLSPSVQFDPYGTFLVDETLVQKKTDSRPTSPAAYGQSPLTGTTQSRFGSTKSNGTNYLENSSPHNSLPHHIVTQAYSGNRHTSDHSAPSMFPSAVSRDQPTMSASSPSPSPASSREQFRRPILRSTRRAPWSKLKERIWSSSKGNLLRFLEVKPIM